MDWLVNALPRRWLAGLRDLRATAEDIVTPAPSPQGMAEAMPFELTGGIQDEFLIGLQSGLAYYRPGCLRRLLDGYVYGISRRGRRWYVAWQRDRRYSGEILSFELREGKIHEPFVEATRVGLFVHQIVWDGDRLLVADSQNDRLLEFDGTNKELHPVRQHPLTRRFDRRRVHCNSIRIYQGRIYLMFHNVTRTTGRSSQIVVLDRSLRLERVLEIDAGGAHNIDFQDGKLMYCNSDQGNVAWGDRVFRVGGHTRGLAVIGDRALVGISEVVPREQRPKTLAQVVALDLRTGAELGRIKAPRAGGVLELALVDSGR